MLEAQKTGITKQVPIRLTLEEWMLLHRAAEPGGIQRLVRSWLDPHLKALGEKQSRTTTLPGHIGGAP